VISHLAAVSREFYTIALLPASMLRAVAGETFPSKMGEPSKEVAKV